MNFKENKELNAREIEQKRTVLESKVTSLVVTLTTKCNIVCRMCEEYKIPWDIPPRVIDEIVGLVPYLEQVIWQGGEVLLLDHFKEVLLEEARKHPNVHQSIITNGLPIDEALAEKLVGENMELTFSIDGSNRESYERIRRGAQFERLTRNIRMVNELRARRQPKNMSVRMHAVIMRSNYTELEQFVDFAKAHGFDALHLMPIWGNIEGDENIFHHGDAEALEYIRTHIGKAESKAREYGLNLLNSLPFSGDPAPAGAADEKAPEREPEGQGPEDRRAGGRMLCHMPWKRMVINPAGYVCPACHCAAMIGNVNEKSLDELWNSETMQLYRRNIAGNTCEGFCNPSCTRGVIAEELRGLR